MGLSTGGYYRSAPSRRRPRCPGTARQPALGLEPQAVHCSRVGLRLPGPVLALDPAGRAAGPADDGDSFHRPAAGLAVSIGPQTLGDRTPAKLGEDVAGPLAQQAGQL